MRAGGAIDTFLLAAILLTRVGAVAPAKSHCSSQNVHGLQYVTQKLIMYTQISFKNHEWQTVRGGAAHVVLQVQVFAWPLYLDSSLSEHCSDTKGISWGGVNWWRRIGTHYLMKC